MHTSSNRREKPFLTQNCSSYSRDSFGKLFSVRYMEVIPELKTGQAYLKAAKGGNGVFLDEINSMNIGMQAKLLRVLEEKKITRIGATEPIDVDVRIIAAVNQPPLDCVKNGTLRDDLFYRLGSVMLNIPPLRERKEDIELLTRYYSDKYSKSMKKNIIGVSQDVMTIFHSYYWPGNVRELRNVIEGAFNLCDTTIIGIGDLPSYMLRIWKWKNWWLKIRPTCEIYRGWAA